MKKIILIDDNPDDLLLMSQTLEYAGYHVVTYNKAKDALRDMSSEQPDLVVTDMVMPDMEGFETVEYIRSEYHNKLPVIITSGSSKYFYLAEELEVDGICLKSSNCAELIDQVSKVLEQ